jgi:hypothetical protein
MSSYCHGFDNEEGTCYIECMIEYSTEEPYHEPATWSCPEYSIDGEIIIESVDVLFVEYYDPHGNVIAKIKGEDMQEQAKIDLDNRVEEQMINEVCDGDPICDTLWENRG